MFRILRPFLAIFCLFVVAALACGCSSKNTGYQNGRYRGTKPYTVRGKTYYPLKSAHDFVETGVASWYGPGFHGKKTSNGERYNQNAMTAAHKLLPFGTRLKVTNLDNGRVTEVRVNDRGPFVDSRVIDLSRAAAKDLGMLGTGTARVRIVALENGREPALLTPDGDMLGLFYVQIGSFRERPRAVNLADFMRTRGYGCRIARHDGNDLSFVQLGPYPSRSQAEKTARSLSLTYRGLFVIAE
ncbi:septal ring lytic transglycosylase RlpA family protein [Mailhella massiliensis]|uniref:septal ring lytic transglycosylase RlpA family protein n=1 Tax=Mailhella massiliensis TaxID=1903261 RepID=UPI0026F10932|nr:septal ring lytic transglycosylase RlpA family protein [Mailhella massiliensis]